MSTSGVLVRAAAAGFVTDGDQMGSKTHQTVAARSICPYWDVGLTCAVLQLAFPVWCSLLDMKPRGGKKCLWSRDCWFKPQGILLRWVRHEWIYQKWTYNYAVRVCCIWSQNQGLTWMNKNMLKAVRDWPVCVEIKQVNISGNKKETDQRVTVIVEGNK